MRGAPCRVLALVLALAAFSAQAGGGQGSFNTLLDVVKGVAQSQQVASMGEADEIAAGREIAARTLGTYPLVKDGGLQRYLNRVGTWVALQSSRPGLPWRFAAVESAQINAFAVPGGVVLVTRGMLGLIANEAELACVLGHEVGHVVRKHHLALFQKELLLKTGSAAVSAQTGMDETKKLLAAQGSELFTRALDRDSERDADADGVLLAARAGYDPASCRAFMQRMAEQKQDVGALAALYKTHPRPADRLADIAGALARLEGMPAEGGIRPALEYKKRR